MSAFYTSRDVSSGVVLDNYMFIDAAAEYSGCNAQYFRRLMRRGAIVIGDAKRIAENTWN